LRQLRTPKAILSGALWLLASASAAFAQTVTIPAQNLKSALEAYIRQTGIQLIYNVDDINGVTSHDVRGASSANALNRMLEGTGISANRDRSGAVIISRQISRQAARRSEPARALGDGERRLVEISRALVMRPRLLLVDESSASLEPADLDAVHAMLCELRDSEHLSVVMVESNAKRGLKVADIGCLVRAGEVAAVGTGAELLGDATIDLLS